MATDAEGNVMDVALATPISLRSFGGAERKILEAAVFLAKGGNRVTVYALPITHSRSPNSSVNDSLRELDIRYCEEKRVGIDADVAYLVYVPIIWRRFEFSCPTIAGLHSPLLFPSKEGFETFLNPVSAIKRYHTPRYAASYWFSVLFKNWDLSAFDAVRVLNSCFKVRHKRVHCIPDWVNSSVFRPRVKQKGEVFTLLFAGRHHWEKGFDVFLKVVALLEKKLRIKFLCTGKGFGVVEGKGFLSDEELAEVYSESHLVLYPSRMDTVGGVIVEAAACGTPVATTPIPAHSLDLPLFYAATVKGFADTVVKVYNLWLSEREKYYRIARAFHEKSTCYSFEKIFPKFESMLKSAKGIR